MQASPAESSSRGSRVSGSSSMVQPGTPRKQKTPTDSRKNQASPKKKAVQTVSRGRSSSGKITFLTRLACCTIRLPAILRLSAKMLNMVMPQNMISGKAARLSSSVSMPQRALKMMPKTKVYTVSIISGWAKHQMMPSTEPR